ncbi:hypothetical protein [Streptomyces cahuitamycinicus]|uniref:Uncharacterized protein n=1 Tax=Streptomyces cahuitamycinicus TaxID=2070367 RepID=A0A2N8TND3_9ACTN|nr:hypothetical protein [Streptomyces cahuitamycinicus]PNG20525.1 hypothetical protein C1J00_19745 [Streptomyces cahuitamycinicus]
MAPKTDHLMSLRAERQLRQVRAFYTAGVLLWATAAAFTGLLLTASLWLRRIQTSTASRPAHHAAPRHVIAPRHANA